jgi:hypothetical protein
MTTGCICTTPGCGGLSPTPEDRCERCEIDAMPPGWEKTVRRIVSCVLNGPDREAGE